MIVVFSFSDFSESIGFIKLSCRDISLSYREYEKLIEESTVLLDSIGFNSTILLARAEAYLEIGDDTKAIIDMNTVIEKDSTNTYAYYKRAKLHKKYDATSLANANFEMVLKLDTISNSSSNRHYALFHLGYKDEAFEWINRILSTSPDAEGIYYDKACLLALIGNKEEALKSIEKALELGYNYFAHIKKDNDLQILRQEPEFIALIEKYEAIHDSKCAELLEP